jgi:hypothetical protein
VTTVNKKTFATRVSSKANEVGGACDYVIFETVHEDGRVDVRVKGIADGERIDQKKTRPSEGMLDLATVTRARLEQGWTEVSS